jgi:methylenetetrahydrofolate reductase (NADPH)
VRLRRKVAVSVKGTQAYGGTDVLFGALAYPRFELIPVEGAEEPAAHLPGGAKVTVTCSPTRGLESTLLLAEELSEMGFRAVPHISARLVSDAAHLKEIVRRLEASKVREVFVIGGDVKEPAGPFSGALDLLRAMSELGHDFANVGVAGYPEGHPLIGDDALRQALLDKQRFATYVVTQMCFDASSILRWVSGIRQGGIELPVYVGLPGVVKWRKLLRITLKIGVGDSARFLTKNAGALKMLHKPAYKPGDLIGELAPHVGSQDYNIQGIHFYTFNQTKELEEWRRPLLEPAEEAAT